MILSSQSLQKLADIFFQIVLKTLMVFHRFMRDCPTSTRIYQRLFPSLHEFRIPRFLDDSSNEGMQASMMVRSYAVYMEEKLQVYGFLIIDIDRCTLLCKYAGRARDPLRLRPVCPRLISTVSTRATVAETSLLFLTHTLSVSAWPPPF